jgi:hypothetical protein
MSKLQPRIVTLAELKQRLLPLAHGDKWAEGAIVDLWKKGAPVPQPAGQPERRTLIPEQFAMWFTDFQQRLGLSQNSTGAYSNIQHLFSGSAGNRRRGSGGA